MNSSHTQLDIHSEDVPAVIDSEVVDMPSTGLVDAITGGHETLHALSREICDDAHSDSLKYLLRSDTGHDGE